MDQALDDNAEGLHGMSSGLPSSQRLTRDELVIDYVLGMAEAEDHERALRLLESDAAFRRDVIALREKLGELDSTAPVQAPEKLSWSSIETAIDAPAEPRRAPVAAEKSIGVLTGLWESLGFWRPAALAASVAAALMGAGLLREMGKPPSQPVYVAVLQTGEGRAQAVVNAYADGTVTLVPIDSIGVPEGRILEVWTLQSREQGPVSIGRMDRARTLKLDLKQLQRPDAGHLFEITVEPPGGSPTGRPTGPVLSKGLAGQAL
jgi:anti-sigma-K factor RskA